MIDLLLFVILLACVAVLWNEGCWSNMITLVNVTLAGLLAFNYFEPLAAFFESQEPTYTYLWDFLAVWVVFAVSLGLLRLATDSISKQRVRFMIYVEQGGRVLFGLWAGWVFVCFAAATLHMAPLPVNGFSNSFDVKPNEGLFFGFAPDRQWLAFIQGRSQGALSASGDVPSEYPDDAGLQVFDPRGEFLVKYRQRRKDLDEHFQKTDTLRVGAGP